MKPFFGPDRAETLRRLRQEDVALPITLGDGAPSFRIDCHDGEWMLCPLVVDSEAAAGLQQAVIDDSGLYTWDFMAVAEPLFSSTSKAEFIRWVEMWPWLGTGERRAAPSHPEPERVEFDFENLAREDRTVFRWSRQDERTAVVRIDVELRRGGRSTSRKLEAPAHLWAELIDVLRTRLPPLPMRRDRDEITAPQIKVPSEVRRQKPGARNLAPTEPLKLGSEQFVRARICIEERGVEREVEIEGEGAVELLATVSEFASVFGADLQI